MGIVEIEDLQGRTPKQIEDEWIEQLKAVGWKSIHQARYNERQYCSVCKAIHPHWSVVLLRRDLGYLGIETAEETICTNCQSVAFTAHEDAWSSRVFLKKKRPPTFYERMKHTVHDWLRAI